MKLKVVNKILVNSLSHIQGVVERKNTIAILSNVRIEALSGLLILNGTDQDIDIKETINVEAAEDGSSTVPAHLLYDILRKIELTAEITLETKNDSSLTIKSDNTNASLPALPIEDFPIINQLSSDNTFAVSSSKLKHILEKAKFAISHDETRYYLNGVYLEFLESGKIRAVATDGHRMACIDAEIGVVPKNIQSMILPKKSVNELTRLLDREETEVEITVSDSNVNFKFDTISFTSKLIDANFPDYDKVIPKNNTSVLEVNREKFKHSVDFVSTVSEEKIKTLKMTIVDTLIKLSVNTTNNASASQEVENNGDKCNLVIGFNASYLIDIANNIEEEELTIALDNASAPIIVRGKDNAEELYILMPMRL